MTNATPEKAKNDDKTKNRAFGSRQILFTMAWFPILTLLSLLGIAIVFDVTEELFLSIPFPNLVAISTLLPVVCILILVIFTRLYFSGFLVKGAFRKAIIGYSVALLLLLIPVLNFFHYGYIDSVEWNGQHIELWERAKRPLLWVCGEPCRYSYLNTYNIYSPYTLNIIDKNVLFVSDYNLHLYEIYGVRFETISDLNDVLNNPRNFKTSSHFGGGPLVGK